MALSSELSKFWGLGGGRAVMYEHVLWCNGLENRRMTDISSRSKAATKNHQRLLRVLPHIIRDLLAGREPHTRLRLDIGNELVHVHNS